MNKKAFSLVELLVVIAVIGILATLAVVSLQGARKGARDAKRIANIKQIQTALELYYNDQGQYPESLNFGQGSIESPNAVYMEKIPSAPSPADGNCGSNNAYLYIPIGINGRAYQISFCLGSKVGQLDPGPHCAKPGGIIPGSCGDDFICGDPLYDSRDGNTYETLSINGKCWFKQNLRYLPAVYTPSEFNNRTENGQSAYAVFAYDGNIPAKNIVVGDIEIGETGLINFNNFSDDFNIYSNFGVLYNQVAVQTENVCPNGWHISNNDDWTDLENFLGEKPVKKLSSIEWGTNESGLSFFPSGMISFINYPSIPYYTNFWGPDNHFSLSWRGDDDFSFFCKINEDLIGSSSHGATASITNILDTLGLTVRCVKD